MSTLSKRLEIRLDQERFAVLKKEASKQDKSIAELIREAIDKVLFRSTIDKRLEALKKMGKVDAPVSSWETMEKEIEKGHLK